MHFSVSYKFWLNSSFYSTNLILAITETFQFTTQLLRFYDDFMFLHSFHHLDTAATLIDDAFTGSFIFKNNQRPLQHQQQTWQQHTWSSCPPTSAASSLRDNLIKYSRHQGIWWLRNFVWWIYQPPATSHQQNLYLPTYVIPYCPSNNQEKWKFIKFHQSSTLARFICKTII